MLWCFKVFVAVLKNTWLNVSKKVLWRSRNTNNDSYAVSQFNHKLVKVGAYTYGDIRALTLDDHSRLKIGSFCSIAPQVIFIVSAGHDMHRVSTYPFKAKVIDGSLEGIAKGDIIIGDDVWIGYGATILSGVRIGQGAVIAAGAVVDKDVPPYAVFGGVPAKVIKYRFDQPIIKYLLTLDYSSLTKDMINSHLDDLYKKIDDMSLDEVKKLYAWFPKKKKGSKGSARVSNNMHQG